MDLKKQLNTIITEEVKKQIRDYVDNKSKTETYSEKIDRLDSMTEVEETDVEYEEHGDGELNENVLRLNRKEMVNLIRNMAAESSKPLHEEKKEPTVKKKVKTKEKTEKKKEKVARQNTKEEDKVVADNRGYGLEDIKFDNEPSDFFKERMRKAIVGDASMGNAQHYANVLPSKTGEKILDKAKRKKEQEEKKPMYDKDPQPVKIVKEELEKIKHLFSYNQRTN